MPGSVANGTHFILKFLCSILKFFVGKTRR